jgi:hypothetical protein
MREILLTKGLVAIVDDRDYPVLRQIEWCVARRPHTIYARNKAVLMHRFILDRPSGDVDHINGDGLDNRRANLRVTTRRLNNANAFHRSGGTSRFKGVSWDARRMHWQAGICPAGKRISLGRFAAEIEAAVAYDEAAREAFGAFARLNFPKPGEQSAHRSEIGAA